MQTIYLLFTALTVSADSFLCGLSLHAQYKGNLKMIAGICISVTITCILGGIGGKETGVFLQNYSNLLGGLILYFIGVINAIDTVSKPTFLTSLENNVFIKSVTAGVGVGLDGALASFSLVAIGYNAFMVVSLITATHLLTLIIAVYLLDNRVAKAFLKLKLLPPFILALLGAIKTASFF